MSLFDFADTTSMGSEIQDVSTCKGTQSIAEASPFQPGNSCFCAYQVYNRYSSILG